jgi:RimJ/RimL family protein N-acetyltransferase
MNNRTLRLPLVGDRLAVRELVPDDLQTMHSYASRPEVARYLMWGPNSLDETEASLASFVAAQKDTPRLVYELGISLLPGNDLVGALCLYLGDREVRNDAEVGFALHPDYWGQGYVTEAARLLLVEAFHGLGLRRIWATCDARNEASIGVLEKLQMRREGAFKARRSDKGAWVDEYSYAVLASEFS